MKTLLENWKHYLNENLGEEGGSGLLLYHATCFPPESFIKGIDGSKAKGFGQGAGFYFYTKKENAINHGKNLVSKDSNISKQVKCPENSKGSFIIVSDEPITPENFDIDYEVYATGLLQFIKQNLEFFSNKEKELSFKIVTGPNNTPTMAIIKSGLSPQYSGRASLNLDTTDVSVLHGELLSLIAYKISQLSPEMFKKFEEQFLKKANAIKYNGDKVIYPLRIEDLEGNIVWNRSS